MAECSMWHCENKVVSIVSNATTERLNEVWPTCMEHTPKIIRYIIERDAGWGIEDDKVNVQQIALLDLPGEEPT
jgi:hypothetical protein